MTPTTSSLDMCARRSAYRPKRSMTLFRRERPRTSWLIASSRASSSLVTVAFTKASGTCCASTSTTAVERYKGGSDRMTLIAATHGSANASTASHFRRSQTARRRSIPAPFCCGSSSSRTRLNSSLIFLSRISAERSATCRRRIQCLAIPVFSGIYGPPSAIAIVGPNRRP